MSGQTTRQMIALYEQEASPTMFLSGLLRSPARNFHTTEEVEFDIIRSGEDVATVITDLSTGGNLNELDGYTNKSFKPPIFQEQAALNSFDLIKRQAGVDPFQSPDFQANATLKAFSLIRKLDDMVRRAVELQASQMFQTGVLTLLNKAGVASYSLDYKPKVTHFPTVAISWSSGSSDKLGDIQSLGNVIRQDGLSDPNMLIFGETAWSQFINDTNVLAQLDTRRVGIGEIRPENRGEGAVFQGFIWIGSYRYEMWTYTGRYKHPTTGVPTKFIADDKVIVMDGSARFDLTFGAIPLINTGQPPALPGLPQRMNSTTGGFGITTNSWVTQNGTSLFVSAGSRPLCIPTAIDRYGAIDTTV